MDNSKRKPSIGRVVPVKEFRKYKSGKEHLYTMPVTKENLDLLPSPYEDASGLILLFPANECPKSIVFFTKKGEACERDIVNVMAYKEADGTEIIKIRLK